MKRYFSRYYFLKRPLRCSGFFGLGAIKHSKGKGRAMKSNAIKKISIITLSALLASVLVLAGQVAQFVVSVNDTRDHAINQWNRENPELVELSNSFVRECLSSQSSKGRDLESELKNDAPYVSIDECGDRLGALDLVSAVRVSEQSLKTFAWPLSIFAD